jgi:hypothetical protein
LNILEDLNNEKKFEANLFLELEEFMLFLFYPEVYNEYKNNQQIESKINIENINKDYMVNFYNNIMKNKEKK